MTTETYIISGFLGAGKTTFIQKLLKEAFSDDKVVLIENDFGEISVDAALLKADGVEVKEMNSGCICCSLSGDFVKAVKEIVERFHPDKIVIEPSGVGKLSDIIKACDDARINKLVSIAAKITVADVKRCKMYLDNFGEFFEDQIQNANVVMLSRVESFPDKVESARKLIEDLNPKAAIFSEPWSDINAIDVLTLQQHTHNGMQSHHHDHKGCEHTLCEHDHCDHHHSAKELFDTVTIRTSRKYQISELKTCMYKAEHELTGTILRAKGIVKGTSGYLNLQYVPGDLKITGSTTAGDLLCFIGKNINRNELTKLFGRK